MRSVAATSPAAGISAAGTSSVAAANVMARKDMVSTLPAERLRGVWPRHILDYFERGDNRNACVVCFFLHRGTSSPGTPYAVARGGPAPRSAPAACSRRSLAAAPETRWSPGEGAPRKSPGGLMSRPILVTAGALLGAAIVSAQRGPAPDPLVRAELHGQADRSHLRHPGRKRFAGAKCWHRRWLEGDAGHRPRVWGAATAKPC